ncbi:MAG TPA: site-2 protease family protein [Bellilinea sp.]|nr:site-2 protease family protein [Bellilinea sp.]
MLDLNLPTLISRVVVLIVAFTIHEFAHAFIADSFGDDTPRNAGRLTLNPLAHLDPFGSLLLLLAGFGWAKPVPVNPNNFKKNANLGMMLVSIAGPASNFIMAALAALLLRFDVVQPGASSSLSKILPSPYQVVNEFVIINLVLLLFNLIPLSPLDGEKVAQYFAPPFIANFYERIRPFGPYALLALFIIGPRLNFDAISWVLNPALPNIWHFLVGA